MRVLPALALLLAFATPARAAVEGFLYTRPVEVPAKGWVRVPLDLAALQHLGPEERARVFAPGGAEVPARTALHLPEGERREVEVVGVEQEEDAWIVRLDLGPAPPRHERLFFELSRSAAAPEVRLEGSDDGESWQPLATGGLFRLGGGPGLQRSSLAYAPTGVRYLRLLWPEAAGLPRVSRVEVETAPGRSLAVTSPGARCRPRAPAGAVCTLPLPAAGQALRRLRLDIASDEGSVAYRLYAPAAGRWRLLAEGVWQRSGRRGLHLLPLDPEPVAGDALRLELDGRAARPELAGFGADLALRTVLFRAAEAGTYTLAYGAAAPAPSGPAAAAPASGEVAWLAPGAEEEHPVPPLPAAAAAPGEPLDAGGFAASWAVAAPGAAPGALVRLELPAAVYVLARPDLGDLRLAAGGRQVPYLLWEPPAPVQAAEAAGLAPRRERRARSARGGESVAEVDLPGRGLPLTQLLLTAAAAPLDRPVAVLAEAPRGERPRHLASLRWECLPRPPLPCRADVPLSALPVGPAPQRLALRFEDGDDPPLAAVAASVWRRRHVLVFAWPEGGVRLLAGNPELPAPDYDLAGLRGPLLARPWQPAELDLTGEATGPSPWSRWLLPATLAVAGAFLILLLRRILTSRA